MFAFNPTVQDRSGELIAQGMNNAAELQLAGYQALGESLSGLGKNIADSYSKAQENRIASDGINAKFDMLKGLKKSDGTPLFTQETIEKFDTMPLGKRQAYVSTAESIFDDDLKKWMINTQYSNSISRIGQNAANQAAARQPAANQVVTPAAPASSPSWFGLVPDKKSQP
jgi:hypothetical protein